MLINNPEPTIEIDDPCLTGYDVAGNTNYMKITEGYIIYFWDNNAEINSWGGPYDIENTLSWLNKWKTWGMISEEQYDCGVSQLNILEQS